MSAILPKLAGLFAIVALGWLIGRQGWLVGRPAAGRGLADSADSATAVRALSALVFLVLLPALLFRTAARVDVASLPATLLAAFFVPVVTVMLAVHWVARRRRAAGKPPDLPEPPEAPAVVAITATFGNTVQLGIPLIAALYGPDGLQLHLAIIAIHALVLLVVATALAEGSRARSATWPPDLPEASGGRSREVGLATRLLTPARQTLIHPVVLPVLAGLAWGALFGPLPAAVDEWFALLGGAAVPLCLLLIGLSLAQPQSGRGDPKALALVAGVKLMLLPAAVWAVAGSVFGLAGTALAVVVLAASLPSGTNALMFAQRYDARLGETTWAIVITTFAFAITGPMWAAALARWA